MKTIPISQRQTLAKHLINELSEKLQSTYWLSNEAFEQTVCKKAHEDYRLNKGRYLSVCPQLNPKLFALCHQVQRVLHCSAPIDYLLRDDPSVNAFAIYIPQGKDPSLIRLNSGAIEHLTEDELKWLIGHEIGHIINHDTALDRLYDACYEWKKNTLPLSIKNGMHYHDLLRELEADRYGLLACGSEEIAMRAICKFQSGGKVEQFDLEAFLQMNHELALYFLQERKGLGDTHPIYPIRVEALHIFAHSKSSADLQKQMKPILTILEYFTIHS